MDKASLSTPDIPTFRGSSPGDNGKENGNYYVGFRVYIRLLFSLFVPRSSGLCKGECAEDRERLLGRFFNPLNPKNPT